MPLLERIRSVSIGSVVSGSITCARPVSNLVTVGNSIAGITISGLGLKCEDDEAKSWKCDDDAIYMCV